MTIDNLTLVACVSIFSASICMGLGSIAIGFGEAGIAEKAMTAIAQQPDEAGEISKTLYISMSLCESAAIYCLVIAMILIFANPFWNTLIQKI